MAKDALLTSEKFVKSITAIDDNIAGKYLLPSILEAQEVYLASILGSKLLKACKEKIASGELINEFSADFSDDFTILTADEDRIEAVIKHCQYYLAYKSVSELIVKVSYKIANKGVNRTTDDNVQAVSFSEVISMQEYYIAKADFFALQLQRWLCNNRQFFPELSDCHIENIKSNLYSAATCGIFLGGARGKRSR